MATDVNVTVAGSTVVTVDPATNAVTVDVTPAGTVTVDVATGQGAGTGDVIGPASAVSGHLAVFSGPTGKQIVDGGAVPSAGLGTVTSVSVATANGVSGSVATATTTPAITLALGAITPSSVNASGTVAGSNLSGTNTGDQSSVTGNAGTATKLATGRTISITGDLAFTSPAFDGSGNVTAAGTIANNAVTTAKILNANVTLAKIANASANSKLLGSGASGSGNPYAELTLGTNLSMSGTTLNASGGGGGSFIVKQADYTAVSGDHIVVIPSAASVTITMPASPADGDYVYVEAGYIGVNGVVLNGGGIDITNFPGGGAGPYALPAGTAALITYSVNNSFWYAALTYTQVYLPTYINSIQITLANGSLATTQSPGDNSTKVATTAYADGPFSTAAPDGTYAVPTSITILRGIITAIS